ncbi:MAG: DUF1592 domain-containing protein [Rubripirellula sp.]|nr:DUF1592 domain-containing protein [Rubripirellula sp.]
MPRSFILAATLSIALASAVGAEPMDQAVFDAGGKIFREQCADCHGPDGQGTESEYNQPLLGNGKLPELTRVVELTMPEGDPSQCVGSRAEQVAYYLYHEFYSLAARRRKGLAPEPRIELSRLTVNQHRNLVADLIAAFTPLPQYESQPPAGYRRSTGKPRHSATSMLSEPGLRGAYFQSRGMSKADRLKLERIDRRIDFDFGGGSPIAEISADQFAIIWEGSVTVHDSGYHEFRIRTQNGARLYVNHGAVQIRNRLRDDSSVAGNAALIDAWVGSGKMRTETARIFLIGGRRYPLRLEFFKYQDDSASIYLESKSPGGVWRVLNQDDLSTAPAKRIFAADIPFPPDDRSLGYERGSSVSNQWHVATSDYAVAAAGEVINRLPSLAKIENDTPERQQRMQQFANEFAALAYRRPVTDNESDRITKMLADPTDDLDRRLLRVLLMILKSPNFLYTQLPLGEAHHAYEKSASLALIMWDSIPDADLTAATESNSLNSPDDIRRQAKRMLDDPRTRAKLAGFFRHWLEIEDRDLSKDRELFPEFDAAVVADLRTSLLRFIDQVVWSEKSDYRNLLNADYLLLNDRLQAVYAPRNQSKQASESDQPPSSTFQDGDSLAGQTQSAESLDAQSEAADEYRQFSLTDQNRSGLLTHPYLLSAFSYHNNTSPVHRGVFLTRNIIGRGLKPPPEAVAFNDDEFPANLTMREKVTSLTQATSCMSCHSIINPLGFTLESYDPVGRFRTSDGEKQVNTKAQYVSANGEPVEFKNAVDLAKFAIASEDAHRAFVKQLFHHLVKQDPDAYGEETLSRLVESFAADQFNVQNLMIEIAVVATANGESED